ncbi:MAG: Asp-tRNA(Asn)/Glu-tRNA(Gln) amidotransferase subunit GatB [Patescibacteria group bacterium]|nr:Asp-tRNA(Asn)/Glu-tRNA(Gln) amidotransferase subunit GatB [Patescibacteria group bacterium]
MKLEPVIGLEIHVQLKTKSKMFCGCSNRGEYEPPNTTVCPICLGQPGALPAVNKQAVEFGLLVGHALACRPASISRFDRKNYFYPDLPKGYQISQKDLPVAENGTLSFEVPEEGGRRSVTIRINRAHLEEDAAKLLHSPDGMSSFVDFNRGGTPLIEIVTEPDLRTPAEAKAFLQELRLIMRYLGVSDADMEKGHLRCDANISMREVDEDGTLGPLNPKTEVKNINSFRAVEHALEYEIKRQTKLWIDGKPIKEQSTRGWDDAKKISVAQRTKEEAHDYRYFPEPDLPPLDLTLLGQEVRGRVPELPANRRRRFAEEYGFTEAEARVFCDDQELADYAERVMSELQEWAASLETKIDWEANRRDFARLVAGWLLTKLTGLMTEKKIALAELKITPENFAELLAMLHGKKVTGTNALVILGEMIDTGADPSIIADEKSLLLSDDTEELASIAGNIVVANPAAVEDYRKGKTNSVQFLVGQMMKATRGKADPQTARELIETELKKLG